METGGLTHAQYMNMNMNMKAACAFMIRSSVSMATCICASMSFMLFQFPLNIHSLRSCLHIPNRTLAKYHTSSHISLHVNTCIWRH